LFNRNYIDPNLVDAFNREMEGEYVNIKDFLIAHYKVTEREDTPFWAYCKHMDIPESLKTRLEVFKARGESMVRQYELFKETSWFAVLAGQGMMPDAYHPVADVISDEELRQRLSRIRTAIQDRVNGMPSQERYLKDRGLTAA
ncbi:MAG: tryptophan halogenase, partial [Alphaproteobacteria bacterium]